LLDLINRRSKVTSPTSRFEITRVLISLAMLISFVVTGAAFHLRHVIGVRALAGDATGFPRPMLRPTLVRVGVGRLLDEGGVPSGQPSLVGLMAKRAWSHL
jgi:hypothetical protein